MGIITRTRANPPMLRAIGRYCRYREVEQCDESDLQRVVVPETFVRHEAGSAWQDTLNLASELDLLDSLDGQLTIKPLLRTELAADSVGEFRRALRSVVFEPRHNEGLWTDPWPSEASTEFSRIAAWFLDQPRLGDDGSGIGNSDIQASARRQLKDTNEREKLIETQEQARVFNRWITALGLGITVFDALLPDPTLAVCEELSVAFSSTDELPALEVRAALLNRLPVLTGGAYTVGLDAALNSPPHRPPGAAGTALTTALRRLERRGIIKLIVRKADADPLSLEDSDRTGVTHVKWLPK
jgi:hypothetical protein